MSYLNVVEVESALAGLAKEYPDITELITLPNKTWEGRTSHVLRIGHDSLHDGVLFTACQHAREWGGAEISVYFAADLLEAYTGGTGLTYGGTSFSSWTVQAIVDRLSVFVYPCVNPDGRKFDQEHDALWRKNRSPANSGGIPSRIGVDLNRNQPWLWDFHTAFAPAAQSFGTLASDDPGDLLYHGPSPGSEPEGANIRWLLDTYRTIGRYLDIHSYTGDLLFTWGDDSNQTVNPAMNFRNPAYDGQRGVQGGYEEYIDPADLNAIHGIANRVVNAMKGVRGQSYVAKQSVFLWGNGQVGYPTSGTVDDYVYSRHQTSCLDGKVLAFTLEFGFPEDDVRTSFHPPWPEMEKIVVDADAGLVEFCAAALPRWVPPWIVAYRRLWPWEIYGPVAKRFEQVLQPLLDAIGDLRPRQRSGPS
ncbi:MAG: M14 family zinc carboxypeptidase [Acidimicrobiales bacterium]